MYALGKALRCALAGTGLLTGLLNPIASNGQNTGGLKESPYTQATHERIHYGLRAGLNFSSGKLSGDSPLDAMPSFGWTGAGVASYRFNSRYGLKAEFGFTRKVTKYQADSLEYENTLRNDFLEVALVGTRRFPLKLGSNSADFFLEFGPSLSYWLGSTGSVNSTSGSFDYNADFSGKQDSTGMTLILSGANRWLVGAEIGAGVMVPFARNHRLLLELRATLGITPLGKEESAAQFNFPVAGADYFNAGFLEQRIHSLTLSASYVFSHNLMQAKLGKSNKTIKKRDPKKEKKDKNYLDTRIKSKKSPPQ